MNTRTRSQVLAERKNAVAGGCCDRWANMSGCDCFETALPDPVDTLTPQTVYKSDDTFRLLVDWWVEHRRCPVPLIDRCIELGMESAADCCRWAATEPDRPIYKNPGPDEVGSPCGPYPTQNYSADIGKEWFWQSYGNSASTLPYNRPKETMASREANCFTPLGAILWLLENWRP